MRLRYTKGLTDYRYRDRMLRYNSHNPKDRARGCLPVYRVVVGKRNKYLYTGLYSTPNLNLPDICHYYGDTRGSNTLADLTNRLAMHIVARVNTDSMVVLDKGRRKHLILTAFESELRSRLVALKGPRVRGIPATVV